MTLEYGLSRQYAPSDLVDLASYLPVSVTLGYPTKIRSVALTPLLNMIAAMQAEGLRPTIISGYRSYAAQAIAWSKWQDAYPEHVDIISAPPGHSEHQLGLTVDFGSPELPEIVGVEDIEFHTLFYKTSEGRWLTDHAHEYGFHLSYPGDSQEVTGFFYEPWHYRYLGPELAMTLFESGQTFIEYKLTADGAPCIP